MKRLAYIDGLRGLFALVVALYHFKKTLFFPGGYLAVDFFFVLSGFILAYVYMPRIHRTGLIEFIGSRLSRLWPLHAFTMLLFLAAYSLAHYLSEGTFVIFPDWDGESRIETFFENIFLIHGIGFQNGLVWNYPSWSISVEFWVNILLFLILAALVRLPKNKISILTAIGLVVFFSYLTLDSALGNLKGKEAHLDQIALVLNTGLIRGVAGILLGLLIYKLVIAGDPTRSRWSSWLWGWGLKSLTEIGLFSALIYLIAFDGANNSTDFLAILIFAGLLGILSVGQHSILRQILSLKPFTFLGLISYSIYLGHMPLLQLFKKWDDISTSGLNSYLMAAYFLIATIILAKVLHAAIETPGQKLFRQVWYGVFHPHVSRAKAVSTETR